MDRRIVIVVLVFCLVLMAITFAELATGRADPQDRVPSPTMSGEFANTHFACAGALFAPSVYLPPHHWRLKAPGAGHTHFLV